MVTILGIAHMSWLTMFCSIFYVTFAHEQGLEGTSAENFSCVVYTVHISSMNCTWNAGRSAPKDTQCFLYLKYDNIEHNGEEIECPHYISNNLGRHVGCHFPKVTVNKDKVTLRVTGSSKESPIQISDHEVRLYKYEKLAPPQDITVNCDEQPLCKVEWKAPPSAIKAPHDYCFKYEIKKPKGETHECYPKGQKYILRLRAAGQYCTIAVGWSDWSQPIEFGTDPNPFPALPLLLVAFGTILIILFLIFIYKRFHIWELLVVKVPQPKDILWQNENMENVWVDPIPAGDEKITVVEDIGVSCKSNETSPSCSQLQAQIN
ncbi:granulocyte-macrophage colony-stimulating factor receptor subunit alpha-like isoform X2 [Rhineura floridana]|uniref:granulocyte-macrophage colony-stimulating factor receptor subunit alpha-like isoform X2 n=1 Tax=Rhineura floridana TaxID=261503 RepID=UPI002AC89194|nr:granulocyte-macrophage colony-stimulating factor receptor subunit alpha-like isoform X2 [Rhineura floridana]